MFQITQTIIYAEFWPKTGFLAGTMRGMECLMSGLQSQVRCLEGHGRDLDGSARSQEGQAMGRRTVGPFARHYTPWKTQWVFHTFSGTFEIPP